MQHAAGLSWVGRYGDAVNGDVGRTKATMAEAMLDGHRARHDAFPHHGNALNAATRRGKAHLVAGYNAVALGHIAADIEGIGRNDPQKRLGPDRIGILQRRFEADHLDRPFALWVDLGHLATIGKTRPRAMWARRESACLSWRCARCLSLRYRQASAC